MRRLSSGLTWWYKRAFPALWFGIIAAVTIVAFAAPSSGRSARVMMVAVAVFMAGFGYFVFRKLVFDMVDDVFDEGDSLVVKNRGQSDRIALSDIRNVSYSVAINPPRVTLSLRRPSVFGDTVTFCAPFRAVPFTTHPSIDALIERIDAARDGRRPSRG